MQEELNAQRDQIEEFTDRIQAYVSQIEKVDFTLIFNLSFILNTFSASS